MHSNIKCALPVGYFNAHKYIDERTEKENVDHSNKINVLLLSVIRIQNSKRADTHNGMRVICHNSMNNKQQQIANSVFGLNSVSKLSLSIILSKEERKLI